MLYHTCSVTSQPPMIQWSRGTFYGYLHKAKEKGTTTEILNTLVLSSRTTPNGMSPAEGLMGRKLRTTLDVLCPPKQKRTQKASPNKTKPFSASSPVFARNYRPRQLNWILGTIDRKKKDNLSMT